MNVTDHWQADLPDAPPQGGPETVSQLSPTDPTVVSVPPSQPPSRALRRLSESTQFTSIVFTQTLKSAGVRIAMDGKGRWLDNVFVERLWRSLKYECVYLHAWSGGREAKAGIGNWMDFYNQRRPHAAHDGRTPNAVYHQPDTVPSAEMAA